MTTITERPVDERVAAAATGFPEQEIDRFHVKDQITILGFACRHTPSLLPLPIWLAHKLARRLDAVRHQGTLSYLAPEGRAQVAVEFRDRRPSRIYSVDLIAAQKATRQPTLERLRKDLVEQVVEPVFADEPIRPDSGTRVTVNIEGTVVGGGPAMHAGLTGRKLAVDTYGDYARHSSTALSGKDPFRIGRTGAYAARYAANNVVAAGLAEECEVQMSYAPGYPGPISLQVETFGTGKVSDAEIVQRIQRVFDFRLGALIRDFRLIELPREHADGFFHKLAVYGHMGRTDFALPWEMTDKQDALAG
jgi:S-adenosylmethionine synthetase